jgi:hypothetical protein
VSGFKRTSNDVRSSYYLLLLSTIYYYYFFFSIVVISVITVTKLVFDYRCVVNVISLSLSRDLAPRRTTTSRTYVMSIHSLPSLSQSHRDTHTHALTRYLYIYPYSRCNHVMTVSSSSLPLDCIRLSRLFSQ